MRGKRQTREQQQLCCKGVAEQSECIQQISIIPPVHPSGGPLRLAAASLQPSVNPRMDLLISCFHLISNTNTSQYTLSCHQLWLCARCKSPDISIIVIHIIPLIRSAPVQARNWVQIMNDSLSKQPEAGFWVGKKQKKVNPLLTNSQSLHINIGAF